MRYRLAALLLIAVLSVMSLLIRPTPSPAILDIGASSEGMDLVTEPDPNPFALLDIGPPPKGKTAEEHCKDSIRLLSSINGVLWDTGNQPVLGKLPSAPLMTIRPWLEKNIRVTRENSERRLRLTFCAGTRAEQVVVLNTLLRVYLHTPGLGGAGNIKIQEEALRLKEASAARFELLERHERRIEGQPPGPLERHWKKKKDRRINQALAIRAEIARLKKVVVIKWAK